MNAKLIIYRKEKIQNYESLKQLCLLMNIEIILLNEQMTQNKVKDILNKKIKKTKKNNLEAAVVVFFKRCIFTNGSNIIKIKK